MAVSIVMFVAAWFFFDYNVFKIGLALIPFVINLVIAGWVIGVLTTSLIMRYGQEVEVLAWGMVFLFQPISCVFYPMDILPGWLQAIAWANPAAHVFEGMRGVLLEGTLSYTHLAWAFGLNIFYLTLMVMFFHYMFSLCKEQGLLVRIGE